MKLKKMELRKVLWPMKDGAGIFLGNDEKTFMMVVGHPEATAIVRELQGQRFVRPLTHDLLHYIMMGFDISMKHIIISALKQETFFATLVLEQKVADESGEWRGKRNEVRIDARPSDSIILALKTKADIYVSEEVFDRVEDVTQKLKESSMLYLEDESQQSSFPSTNLAGGSDSGEALGDDDDLDDDEDEDEDDDDDEGRDDFYEDTKDPNKGLI